MGIYPSGHPPMLSSNLNCYYVFVVMVNKLSLSQVANSFWLKNAKRNSFYVRQQVCWVGLRAIVILSVHPSVTRYRFKPRWDLLLVITSTADDLSRGTNIDDLNYDFKPRNKGFSEFFAISIKLPHTFQEWTAPKSFTVHRPPECEIFSIKRRV